MVATTGTRAYVASHFALELEGDVLGFLRSADGGGVKADVLTYQQGGIPDLWRQIGRPKFDDITLQVGMGMSSVFYQWISAFFDREVVRKGGAIVGADFNYREKTRRTFKDALISEVQIPALDGGSKEAAYMTVKVVPEAMEYETADGSAKLQCPPGLNQPTKLWHSANFRFTVDGFEDAFKRTMKVEAFTIKQQILEYPAGNRRTPIRVPGRLEFPNVTVLIPAIDAEPVVSQAKKRLLDYEPTKGGGMAGSLTFVGSDRKTLCTINLSGVDIVSAEPQKFEASAEQVHQVKVQIQVEKMAFEYDQGAVA